VADAPERRSEAGDKRLRFDDSRMTTSYANVCNVASTREEVVLMFGTNQSWQPAHGEITVRLDHRVILSPFAAKRLAQALAGVVEQYEARFGKLDG
jgi:hypothetical protein